MNSVLVLVDSLSDWKPYYETNSILTVSDYLKHKPPGKESKSEPVAKKDWNALPVKHI